MNRNNTLRFELSCRDNRNVR